VTPLAFDLATSLPMLAIILLGAGMLAAALASWAHAHNHASLAEDLDVAHEALDWLFETAKLVTQGTPLPEAIMKVAPSDEAQDLLRRFKVFAHLAPVLLVAFILAGCASPAEDYIRADAAAWQWLDEPYDASHPHRIDAYVDSDAAISSDVKDAIHQLMDGRRARVAHALAGLDKK